MRRYPAMLCAWWLLAAGCGRAESRAGTEAKTEVGPAAAKDADPWKARASDAPCTPARFAPVLDLPEASGATWLEVDGAPALLVVGDSGTRGAYALLDPDSGAVRERGALPLGDGAGDDLEGLTVMDGKVWGLTSAGWMRVWERRGAGFALVDGPYPIAPVDAALPKKPARSAPTDSLACAGDGVNCGKNYEALCLAPAAPAGDACAGFAGSRADGRLWCLVKDGARVKGDPSRSIPVVAAEALTGCDVAPDGETLWVGTNLLDLGRVYRVSGWRTPATAKAEVVAALGVGFPEALAVGPGGAVFRFSDSGSRTSAQGKFTCRVP
jgi:hypothetical protein